ncbi:MAG: tRNA (N(6)-L-threonylcarbamoyladenosine(37)-C(2))-methylthiotransferase [Candidatus Pacebacteria bacterium]|nr:tRNA (N(6)-L-threonylcarbamoyladenosine(37)-C(2))-methylthiotransferase [Candidatus Paceibacterota bacterium]
MNYFIKTFGCKLNHSDSILIEKILDDNGYDKPEDIASADFIIFNTCAVVDNTAEKITKEAKRLKEEGKKIIFGGCLPGVIADRCKDVADGVFSPTNIDDIIHIITRINEGGNEYIVRNNNLDKAALLHDSHSNIVSISEGCLGACTYCATRLARKQLISFKAEDILSRITNIASSGGFEIHLTSQDLAVYGLDRGEQELPLLLSQIGALKGDFKVKLGMMNPGWTIKIIDNILDGLENDHYYKFLHVPLQSGDDDLLRMMNRGYGVSEFLGIANKLRNSFKNSILATDIIVGHPLETDEMFENTIKVIKEVEPDIIHIFKFSRRPNTPDDKLKDLPDRIKKDRSRALTRLFHQINEERNKGFIGSKEKVLVVDKRNDTYLCRNNSGRAIVLKDGEYGLGQSFEVKIVGSKWNYLEGKRI